MANGIYKITEEFEKELIKSENKLKEIGKMKSKYEFH